MRFHFRNEKLVFFVCLGQGAGGGTANVRAGTSEEPFLKGIKNALRAAFDGMIAEGVDVKLQYLVGIWHKEVQ